MIDMQTYKQNISHWFHEKQRILDTVRILCKNN